MLRKKRVISSEIYGHDFAKLAEETKSPKERRRFLAFAKMRNGKKSSEIAKELDVSNTTIHRWLKKFNEKGIEGLKCERKDIKEYISTKMYECDFAKLAEETKNKHDRLHFLVFEQLVKGEDLQKISQKFKIRKSSIFRWVRLFDERGIEGLKCKKRGPQATISPGIYDYDFLKLAEGTKSPRERRRFLALARVVEGKSNAEIVQELKIGIDSISHWMRLFDERGIEGFRSKKRGPKTTKEVFKSKRKKGPQATISTEIYDYDFIKLAEETKSSVERRRFLALARVAEGKSNAEIVQELKSYNTSILRWLKKFNEEGIEGLRGNTGEDRVLSPETYDYDFVKLAESTKSPLERRRFLALALIVEGKKNAEIMEELKVGKSSISRWLKKFNEEGIEGLRGERGRVLSPEIYGHDFVKLAEATKSSVERRRFLTLARVAEGKSKAEIVEELKIGERVIPNWIKKFNEEGIEGLRVRSRGKNKRVLSPEIYDHDFVKLAEETKSPLEQRRFLALALIAEGKKNAEIIEELKIVESSISNWIKKFNEEGIEGLRGESGNVAGKREPSPEIYDYDFVKLAEGTKSSVERRRFLALARVAEGKKNAEIIEELKVGKSSISNWIKKFNREGIEGLREESKGRRVLSNEIYDHDFLKLAKETKSHLKQRRFLALARVAEGKKNTEIMKELKIGQNSISNWIKKFNEEGIEGLVENVPSYDMLKKCVEETKSPTERQRFLALARVAEGKKVLEVSKELEVSAIAIYKWLELFKKKGIEGLKDKRKDIQERFSTKIYEYDFAKLADETENKHERLHFLVFEQLAKGEEVQKIQGDFI
jgi:transposase